MLSPADARLLIGPADDLIESLLPAANDDAGNAFWNLWWFEPSSWTALLSLPLSIHFR